MKNNMKLALRFNKFLPFLEENSVEKCEVGQ